MNLAINFKIQRVPDPKDKDAQKKWRIQAFVDGQLVHCTEPSWVDKRTALAMVDIAKERARKYAIQGLQTI